MNRDYDLVVKQLNADIPSNEVAYRDSGSGRQLAYLEGWVVIDLLNEIVGIGNWAYQTLGMQKVFEGKTPKDAFTTSYIAHVQLTAKIGTNTVTFTDYGYGDGTDKTSAGKAHELAVKEAVTDGIKRCAKSLGRRTGLALYDKTQQFVSDVEDAPKAAKAEAPKTAKAAALAPATSATAAPVSDKYKNTSEKELKDLISATSRVVIKKGKLTKDALIDTLKKEYNTDSKDHLNQEQARKFLLTLESLAQ